MQIVKEVVPKIKSISIILETPEEIGFFAAMQWSPEAVAHAVYLSEPYRAQAKNVLAELKKAWQAVEDAL